MHQLQLTNKELYDLLDSFWAGNSLCRLKFQCRGGSMAPFIRDQDHVTLRRRGSHGKLRTGDIVAAADRENHRVMIHRIVKAAPRGYLLKGDNNRYCDGWFKGDDIWAVVDEIENMQGKGYRPGWCASRLIAMASRTKMLALGRYLRARIRRAKRAGHAADANLTGA